MQTEHHANRNATNEYIAKRKERMYYTEDVLEKNNE